jgi:arylsulfatase A-like enzyme
MMLVSNPGLRENTVTIPVTTMQVAPTILKVLGLNPSALQSVQQEGTETLTKLF